MKKTSTCKFLLLLAAHLFFSFAAFAGGDAGKATASVSSSAVEIGQSVTLSVTVSDQTGDGASGGQCKYTITIPTEITPSTKVNSSVSKGKNGNTTYTHGSYTTSSVGCYTFDLNVTDGSQGGADPQVCFHPKAPVVAQASDVVPYAFTANWEAESSAQSYLLTLKKASGEVIAEDVEVNGTSHPFTGLEYATYAYSVKSKAGDLVSLGTSAEMQVLPLQPSVSLSAIEPFAIVLGENPHTQAVTLTASNLYGDVALSLKSGANSSFAISKQTISQTEQSAAFDITYNPTEVGAHKDTLLISTLYLSQEIPLQGQATLNAPNALDASSVSSSRFTANWEKVSAATNYYLSVKDGLGEDVYSDYVGDVASFEITNLKPEANYKYTVKAFANELLSAASNEIELSTTKGPVVNYSNSASFYQEVNTEDTKTIRVEATNVVGTVSVRIADENGCFSTEMSSLAAAGGEVLVKFNPTQVGVFTAKLILSAEGLDSDVEVALKGTSTPAAVVALPASNITDASFVANWEASTDAVDYLLTLTQDGLVVMSDQSTAGVNSYSVSADGGRTYSYSVKVVATDMTSVASNEIKLITHSAPYPVAHLKESTIQVKWNAVPDADGYEITLYKGDVAVEDYNAVPVNNATSVDFVAQQGSTDYTYELFSLFGKSKYSSGILAVIVADQPDEDPMPNFDFEAWEEGKEGSEDSVEPVSWNSFMTFSCSLPSVACGFAQKKKIEESVDTRPGSKGTKSAKIWSTSVIGIVANGNMTTGQIIAGSTTATETDKNYNQTKREDDAFNMPFKGRPDSISVWVKFVPEKMGEQAGITTTIHGDCDYKDPADSGSDCEVAKADATFYATESKGWQRLSIPFEARISTDPRYILISVTTNKTPGGGTAGDAVYVDDMLLIYKPELSVNPIGKTTYEKGEELNVAYTLTGTMSAYNVNADANVVSLQLSDANGSFENPIVLSQVTTNAGGVLTADIPTNIPEGNNYKLRVVTTNYPMTVVCEATLTINDAMPTTPVALDATAITSVSFVANWEAVANNGGYVVTVNEKDYVVTDEAATSLTLTNLAPETSYSYTVKSLNGNRYSLASNTISVRTSSGGAILYDKESLSDFATIVNEPISQTIAIEGIGLIQDIAIALQGNDAAKFSVDVTELDAVGGDIVVTYAADALGEHTASLVLTSATASSLAIPLKGICRVPSPANLAATAITPDGFTASWAAVAGAESYNFAILDAEDSVVSSATITAITDLSKKVKGLSSNSSYKFTLTAVIGSFESLPAVFANVTTMAQPVINVETTPIELSATVGASTITYSIENAIAGETVSVTLTGDSDISKTDGEEQIEINYSPTVVGTSSATLEIAYPYAETKTIAISAINLPEAVVTSAGESAETFFVAQWTAFEGADSYLLTVKNEEDVVEAAYNKKNVGTVLFYTVSDLSPNTTYSFFVEVVKNNLTSLPSNTTDVTTSQTSSFANVANKAYKLYPNPAEDYIRVEGLAPSEIYVISDARNTILLKGKYDGNSIRVSDLIPGVYVLRFGNQNISFIKK